MHKTGWREIDGGKRRIRATFGLNKIQGNRYAYFSITGETQRKERGFWSEDSFGCIHDEIRKAFPELAEFIPWHLTDETGEPMHYFANGMYWLRVVNFAANASVKPEKARENFKSTVVWGALPEDATAELPGLREGERWLSDRLVKLVALFHPAMTKMEDVGTLLGRK